MNIFRAIWEGLCEAVSEEFTASKQNSPKPTSKKQAVKENQSEDESTLLTQSQFALDVHSLYCLDTHTINNPYKH